MSNFVQITSDELNLQDIINLVGSEDCGAISTFIGIVLSFNAVKAVFN